MPQPVDAPVESLPTRQLLKFLALARRFHGFYSPFDSSGAPDYTYDELKAEANKREHVPNKAEAKAARRRAATGKAARGPARHRGGKSLT